ncbi:MAG: NDP-sugar synthase [Nitrospiria bacterium]
MKGFVLAAGFGTRLGSLTRNLPKPLLPVGGFPMIHYNLLLLKKYGITDVMINSHYLGDKIRKTLGDGSDLGMNFSYSEEAVILGTGGGIKKMARQTNGETFFVINADILIDLNLDQALAFHRAKQGFATLVLRAPEPGASFSQISTDKNDQIQSILSQGTFREKQNQQLMFTGVHIMEPRVLDYIPSEKNVSIIDAYLEMLRCKAPFYGYKMNGYWNDLGDPRRYHQADLDIKEGRFKPAINNT